MFNFPQHGLLRGQRLMDGIKNQWSPKRGLYQTIIPKASPLPEETLKFQVDKTLMMMFYRPVLTFLICWYQCLKVTKVVNVWSKVTGAALETQQDLYNKQLYKKTGSVLSDRFILYIGTWFPPQTQALRHLPPLLQEEQLLFLPSSLSVSLCLGCILYFV